MYVRVELLADDAWLAEDDKTGFLDVGVNIYDWLYLKERPIYLPMVPMSKRWEMRTIWKTQQIEIWILFMNGQNNIFGYTPLLKNRKIKKGQSINFDGFYLFLYTPVLHREYNIFSPNTESSLEQ